MKKVFFLIIFAVMFFGVNNLYADPPYLFWPAVLSFDVPYNPYFVAVGDFNEDGHQDLAVTSQTTNTVCILLGNGVGGFTEPVGFPVGPMPIYIAVGDFNEDGHQDLAVANQDTNYVSILLGDGRGNFGQAINFNVGYGPSSIAIGDFNEDGHQDLVVANQGSNSISTLLGDGTGNFTQTGNFNVWDGPICVAVGDFNEDNHQDLAVESFSSLGWDGFVSIFLGDGTGNFTVTSFFSGYGGKSITIGDFNEDGHQDLAVPNYGHFGYEYWAQTVSVFLGNGTGTFSTPPQFYVYVGNRPSCATIGDFNEDGHQDLAIGKFMNCMSIILGDGSGNFSQPNNFNNNYPCEHLVFGDFNEDHHLDLAIANGDGIYVDSVSILLGDGTGNFGTTNFFNGGDGSRYIAIGDFNEDNHQDLAVSHTFSSDISILLGDGEGNFSQPTNITVTCATFFIAIGDFNEDNHQDIVTIAGSINSISILLGDGTGNFGQPANFNVGYGPSSIAIGDFNEDGHQDLAVANYMNSNISILLGNGTGNFGPASNYNVGTYPSSIAIGDFNEDNHQDLAVVCDSGYTFILLGNGTGGFGQVTNFYGGVKYLAIGDFNKDRHQDLAIVNFNDVAIFFGDGEGNFGSVTSFLSVRYSGHLAVGDINEDNRQDLVVANSNMYGNSFSIFLNNYSPVYINLVPDSTTVSPGGTLGLTVKLLNITSSPQTFRTKIIITSFSGEERAVAEESITLSANQNLERQINLIIPENIPLGEYTLTAYIGTSPDDIWDSDSFDFQVNPNP